MIQTFKYLARRKLPETEWLLPSLLLFLFICNGCFLHYYNTNTTHHIKADTLQKLVNDDKYFILQDDEQAFSLTHIQISDSSIDGKLETLLTVHEESLHPKSPTHNIFPSENALFVLNEVHVYTRNHIQNDTQAHIPFSDIKRIDIYDLDKKSTNKSKVGSIIGITVTTAITVAALAEAASISQQTPTEPTTVSCSPQVFLMNGNSVMENGIICSGAVSASLQRKDWLPLSGITNAQDHVQLMIQGTRDEELFFAEPKLVSVAHSKKQQVLIDRQGRVHTIMNPQIPLFADSGGGENALKEISLRDMNYYSFSNHPADGQSSDLVMDFKKPVGTRSGKLLISAKNSAWAYYAYQQYKSLYGRYYKELIRKKDSADPVKVNQCELDQYLPLLVSIRKNNQWKYLDYFPITGATRNRDLIMNLDLSELEQEDHVRLRFQTTYRFWDLDYAAIDYSADSKITVEVISPEEMFLKDQNGGKRSASFQNGAVTFSDKEELIIGFHINPGNVNGAERSYFLAGKGYYHDNTHFTGKPNLSEIARFSGKGAFDRYSRQKMEELQTMLRPNQDDGATVEQ